jgi:hypothetical protein
MAILRRHSSSFRGNLGLFSGADYEEPGLFCTDIETVSTYVRQGEKCQCSEKHTGACFHVTYFL